MKKEDILFGDWHRWLFGTAPPSFALETAIRGLVIFGVMLVVVRWLGRRMKGQLSVTELAVILTLGAIIAGPMHIPNVGLLPSVVVLLAVLVVYRVTGWLAFKYRPAELVQQGDLTRLICDGQLELKEMKAHALSQEQLFGMLRNQGVTQLGQVRRMYLEANGRLSYYKLKKARPGLSILPRADAPAAEGPTRGPQACGTCGHVAAPAAPAGSRCPSCGADSWQPAAL